MNMCSKCQKDMILKQEQAKLAASSIRNLVHGSGSSSSSSSKEPVISVDLGTGCGSLEPKSISTQPSDPLGLANAGESKVKAGPNRCSMCSKRVGLTGFTCRCGNLFCSMHRYSDKHNCSFDYQTAARDAIAKANRVVKAEKLDKI